jgi:broad specificity phosphatase PhoE
MMTRIILVRHGQTQWNLVEHFRGQADVPLNDTGLAQADAVSRRVSRQWSPTAVYASPLSCAVRTAEAIAQPLGLPVRVHPGLLDIHFGEWQGLTVPEVRARWPELCDSWHSRPDTVHVPGGETLADVRARGLTAVRELCVAHGKQTIVMVGHNVINRVILLGVLGLENEGFWRISQDPCGINVIECVGDAYTLVAMNDTGHLV